ncbi:Excalibur calcium-binding domain-containing protein [Williamsia serinedens]|uniref:Excalibur calcium-binding domain-containing protein n=1 Tax=Williamsia serinedens TaxID=391736 RepID=A0ABT1GZ91_9NOCA|nr:Excalibur calcium-binding domain-containing protein [Williamsia serinedens]
MKSAYRLWVTSAEKDAMVRILTSCGGQVTAAAPTTTTTVELPPPPPPAPTTTEAPRPLVPAATPDGGSAYYRNCSAARAAGAAPLRVGDPGYRAGLDRDGDGVACE